MWRLPQTKALLSPPHSSSLSLHMVTGRPAMANYTHSPVCEVSQRPQSPLTRSRLTLHTSYRLQTHIHLHVWVCLCVCANRLSPLFTQSLPLCLYLAHSEIITHFERLWKVLGFFFLKECNNDRVTITLSRGRLVSLYFTLLWWCT